MRLVELRQLEAILQSLTNSTDISVECANGRLDIAGRNSPYASNTEVRFERYFWHPNTLGRFEFLSGDSEAVSPASAEEIAEIVAIENNRFGLLLNAEPEWFGRPRAGFEHMELAHGLLPRHAVYQVIQSIPGAYLLGFDFERKTVSVVWSRPRVVGWWSNGDPIYAAELTGDLESLRGHRMTHLCFRTDEFRPVLTLPDETKFRVFAYSVANFHILCYGLNEGERTLALLPVEGLDTIELCPKTMYPNDEYFPGAGYCALTTWHGFQKHVDIFSVKTWNLPS